MAAGTRPVIVQKFGGTSVATPEGRAALAERVASARASGRDVVVVVSAMGRLGSPYATDTLLSLVDGAECDARERDLLASCGEIVSCVVIAHELRAAGIPATAFSGPDAGVLTDDVHGDAAVLLVDPAALTAALASGRVPVVAGFQGVSPAGEVTTLGRGGSDTSACAIGVALAAEAVEIYTDVEGVMTADPRVCGAAKVLDALEYEELFQMARHGSRVMHAPAAEAAMDAHVPVRIRGTFSKAPGTLVADAERIAEARRASVATAVSHVDGIARVTVHLPAEDDQAGAMAEMTRVFAAMATAKVSLDMFTPLGASLVFSMAESSLAHAMGALDRIGLPYAVETGLAKVTLVGAGMHGVPGVMARVASALTLADVDVLQVADSHTTISVLVASDHKRATIAALHEAFGLGA
jgi:aspartate kinase